MTNLFIPYGYQINDTDGSMVYFAHLDDALFFRQQVVPKSQIFPSGTWGRYLRNTEMIRIEGSAKAPSIVPKGAPLCDQLFWLGEYLRVEGHTRRALDLMRRSILNGGDKPNTDFIYYAGRLECELGNYSAGIELLRRAYCAAPDEPRYIYSYGSVLMFLGRIAESTDLFKQGARVPLGNGSFSSTVTLCFNDDIDTHTKKSPKYLNNNSDEANSVLFFAAADSVYFRRYAKAVSKSVEQNAGKTALLHFHIINPDCQAIRLAQELEVSSRLNYSTESVDLSEFSETQRKTYFACARYRLLPELMSKYYSPIVVVDMDQILIGDPAHLLSYSQNYDVSLVRFDHQAANILSLFSATLAVFSPNSKAKEFANRLSAYVNQAIEEPYRLMWHLDQAAIARAYTVMPNIRYGSIPLQMLHLDRTQPTVGSTPAIFWSITNSISENLDKLESETFQRYC